MNKIYEDKIKEPYFYLSQNKGKNLRSKIIKFMGKKYNIKEENIKCIIDIIDKIHNTSLILDDIEDGSKIRRGYDAVHIKYGLPLSINVTYIILFEMLNNIKCNKMKDHCIKTILRLSKGQGIDIYISEKKEFITKNHYIEMIKNKTSSLLSLIPKLINSYKEIKNIDQIINLFEDFGIFYQIRDDLINIYDIKYWEKKGFCSDLYEKKITYVILEAVSNKIDGYNEILNFYYNNGVTDLNVKNIYKILKKSDILNNGKKYLNNLKEIILKNAKNVGLFELFNNIFNQLKF